jgi:hypothetical protein
MSAEYAKRLYVIGMVSCVVNAKNTSNSMRGVQSKAGNDDYTIPWQYNKILPALL